MGQPCPASSDRLIKGGEIKTNLCPNVQNAELI